VVPFRAPRISVPWLEVVLSHMYDSTTE